MAVSYQQAGNPTLTPPTSSPKNTTPPAPAAADTGPTMQQIWARGEFPQTPTYQFVKNPNIPGQPFMGDNSAYANTLANAKAGTGNTGTQQQGIAQPTGPTPAMQSQPKTLQDSANSQIPAPAQQPIPPPQSLDQIAPQALLQSQTAQQNQIAQNNSQPNQQQFQQPQVGGFPVQQTQPQLQPTGNLSTPQVVNDPSQQPAPQIDPTSQISAYNQSTGQAEQVSPDDSRFASGQLVANAASYATGQSTPQQNIVDALGSNSQQDFSSMLQNAMQAGPNTSGASVLKLSLQQQLGAIDDPNINTYLNNQISRTQQAYEMGMGYNSAESSELQEAIAGTLTSPQTLIGTQAKQAQTAKDLNLQSLSAQSDWNKAQQAATVDQLQTNRSDLEGFLKAQLALSSGSDSGPSTAALTVMSQSLHEADINMTLQNASYTYGQAQLSIQGSKIMTDYTNQVMTLGAQVNQDRMKTTSDYYDGLSKINDNALANEQQKRQLTSSAYGDFAQKMTDLNNNELNRQVSYAQLAHTTLQDNITDAYNLSGLTGVVYQSDGKGGYQPMTDANGNQVTTLASQQNQFTQANDVAQLQLTATGQRTTIAMDAIQQAEANGYMYGDSGWNSTIAGISQSLGVPESALSTMKNYADLSNYVQQSGHIANYIGTKLADVQSLNNVPQNVKDIFGIGQTKLDANGQPIQCGIGASSLSTAPHVGDTYQEKMQAVTAAGNIQDNPQAGYKLIIPLGMKTDQGAGHVETVLSYDPSTKNMLTIDYNRAGPGVAGMQILNLDSLKQQYSKQGWGFLPGKLQPGIQQKLDATGVTNISQTTPPSTNWDNISNSINSTDTSLTAESGNPLDDLQNSSNPLGKLHYNMAQQLANGQMSPSDLATELGTGALPAMTQKIEAAASQLNPMWNASSNDFYKDWTSASGTNGASINSFNTAIKHIAVLANVYGKMQEGGVTDVNGVINWLKQHASDPEVSEYNGIVNGVADEVAKASTGGAPSVADKAEASAAFNINLGLAGLVKSLQGQMDLMGGKTNTLIESYKHKMGSYPTGTFDPEALQAFINVGMNPAQFDPSLKGTQYDTSTKAPTSDKVLPSQSPVAFFQLSTGGDMSNFNIGSPTKSPADSLQLGVGGDTLGIFGG
jgi:hypothetical protein